MAEMRPPLSPTSNNVKRASEEGASQTSKKQRLGDTPPPSGAADQQPPPTAVPHRRRAAIEHASARPGWQVELRTVALEVPALREQSAQRDTRGVNDAKRGATLDNHVRLRSRGSGCGAVGVEGG